jgi:hypothetical protein
MAAAYGADLAATRPCGFGADSAALSTHPPPIAW